MAGSGYTPVILDDDPGSRSQGSPPSPSGLPTIRWQSRSSREAYRAASSGLWTFGNSLQEIFFSQNVFDRGVVLYRKADT